MLLLSGHVKPNAATGVQRSRMAGEAQAEGR